MMPPTHWLSQFATSSRRRFEPELAPEPVAADHSRKRVRLDEALVARGLVQTRSRAQATSLAGDALVNGLLQRRAGTRVSDNDELSLRKPPRFVSRGGEKLEHALESFPARRARPHGC